VLAAAVARVMAIALTHPTVLDGWSSRGERSTLGPMSSEAALAARAVAGDGAAFAELYELYGQRTFNLCYRITGSREDAADAAQEAFLGVLRRLPKLEGRDVAFGSYVFTAARNACYDLIERRKRSEPSDELPEAATPIGAGPGGGAPPDPGDDPDRNVLLAAQQEEIRAANATLPERQREALALRELEDLSYDEIAEIMDMNRNSVAQLISRARISLRDALRGTALHSIAPSSSDCERGLPLLAMAQDGQLDAAERGWLDGHLAGCPTCRLSQEAMQEAGASYRAWVPIAAAPWLFRETVAKAAELVGADWSEVAERRDRRRPRHPIRNLVVAAALAVVVLLAGLVSTLRDDPPATQRQAQPASDEAAPAEREPSKATKRKPRKQEAPEQVAEVPVVTAEEVVAPSGTQTEPPETERGASVQRQRERSSEPGTELTQTTPTTPEPPPEPPPAEPPPTDPPVEPPTNDPPTVCRDPNGTPIRCPPRP
jgi:RNA polymerase sigma-70 factor (ECF subfamily)